MKLCLVECDIAIEERRHLEIKTGDGGRPSIIGIQPRISYSGTGSRDYSYRVSGVLLDMIYGVFTIFRGYNP